MTTRAQIASLVDHTLLKPEATATQVDALVVEAGANRLGLSASAAVLEGLSVG